MEFDPNNPIVKLCVEGMNAEGAGKIDEAHQLFQQAWDTATNDFEAFTAAHYLARSQEDPLDKLKWNLEALNRADKVQDDIMKTCYPSLYLNVAKSYEDLDDLQLARQYYQLALNSCQYLPSDKLGDLTRSGINAGILRVSEL